MDPAALPVAQHGRHQRCHRLRDGWRAGGTLVATAPMATCSHRMSFDRLAPYYRGMEFICAGEKMQRCRTTFLDQIPATQNILLLGEGHGRCLVECLRRFPRAHITCVDASQRMLA